MMKRALMVTLMATVCTIGQTLPLEQSRRPRPIPPTPRTNVLWLNRSTNRYQNLMTSTNMRAWSCTVSNIGTNVTVTNRQTGPRATFYRTQGRDKP